MNTLGILLKKSAEKQTLIYGRLPQINVFDYLNVMQQHQAKAAANPENWLPWNYASQLESVQKNDG